MRKTLYIIWGLLTVPFLFTACLNDDSTETEYASDALISSFSINDINTNVASKTSSGDDTTLVVSLTGSDYAFTINQNENKIYNVDSLPVGTDITKVSLSISAVGLGIAYEKNEQDTVWSTSDSLDFTNPVKFKVYAYDGTIRTYTAQINVHKQDPDSLQWEKLEGTNLQVTSSNGRNRALTLNDKIYLFLSDYNTGEIQVTSTEITDGKNWTTPTAISLDLADYRSFITFKDKMYVTDMIYLYSSTDGVNWEKVDSDTAIKNTFAASSNQLFAISNGERLVTSTDGLTWTDEGELPETFPINNIRYGVNNLSTNSSIERVLIMGESRNAEDTTAVVWSRLSTESQWTCYQQSADNTYGFPLLRRFGMFAYDSKFYAFGGASGSQKTETLEPYEALYESIDNGITWRETTEKVMLPEDFKGRTDCCSYVIDANNYIWLFWEGSSEVWRGRINRLGFEKKE